jgi:hypothetical protein
MEDKEIQKKMSLGNAIRTITSHPEWKVIEDMLLKEYMDALEILIEKEDEVARATINAIGLLYKKITGGLLLADKAREQLAKKMK